MKLFGIALVCVLSFSTKAIAATEFGLACIQTMFQSRNDYLDVRKGDSWPGQETIFYFYDDGLQTSLETNLWFVSEDVTNVEISRSIIKVITDRDAYDYISLIKFHRYSGEVSVYRYHISDESRIEVFEFLCEKSEANF